MASLFTNDSCDPFTPRERPCEIGAYVQYSVNVSSPEHVVKTLKFVKEHNIRLVVKNTGHEYVYITVFSRVLGIHYHIVVSWGGQPQQAQYRSGRTTSKTSPGFPILLAQHILGRL